MIPSDSPRASRRAPPPASRRTRLNEIKLDYFAPKSMRTSVRKSRRQTLNLRAHFGSILAPFWARKRRFTSKIIDLHFQRAQIWKCKHFHTCGPPDLHFHEFSDFSALPSEQTLNAFSCFFNLDRHKTTKWLQSGASL